MEYLDEKGFLADLRKAKEHKENDIYSSYLKGLSKKEAEEKRKCLVTALKIMRAKTTRGLKGIPLEDVIKSAMYHDEVCEILAKSTAGNEFRRIYESLRGAKSMKRRRVL